MYNFSPRANDLLAQAQLYAKKYSHEQVSSLHLLYAALNTQESVLAEILAVEQGLDIHKISVRLHHILENTKFTSKGSSVKLPLDSESERVLKISKDISSKMDHSFIGTEHIVLGLVCHTESQAFTFLYETEVDIPTLASAIREYLDPGVSASGTGEQEASTGGGENMMKPGEGLAMFSVNMTELAKNGDLDPVIGRYDEIERLMQILCRRQKNNPVLVGEPGVGKTAVVEGLCNMIANDEVPLQLRDKKIYNLDLSLMVAGTKFRGQFEERMKQVMDDLMQMKDAIVFIDEIHMLVGAGNADGAMDAANILKPALSRGGLCCIGTTTYDEYREIIETDGALERRFQKIDIYEPDQDTTIEILMGLKHKYEEFHNVSYTDESIETAVNLGARYITDRFFPDKAIDILDECAARSRLAASKNPQALKKIQGQIDDCGEMIQENLKVDDYLAAATFRSAEKNYKRKKQKVIDSELKKQKPLTISSSHIRSTVSSWCGVPLEHLKKSECKKLIALETHLNRQVLGQGEAINVICDSIIRSRTDVGDPGRPVGAFLLMGPTGVGKTYLAKQLAQAVYGSEDDMIRVDMSELMESHSVSKLIGSPPGYVGYGEGGQLTEEVRHNPYSVVLLDEIEKAHPDVMQILLQLLDEGQLTDSRGVSVNFRNCVVLMTSNIGAEKLQQNNVVGFGASEEVAKDEIKKELRVHLKPEFINRLDEIVIFNSLSKEVCKKILNNELNKFIKRMEKQQVKLKVSAKVKTLLLDTGFDKKFGARPLKRVIQSLLQTPLAKYILHHQAPIEVDAKLVKDSVEIEHKEAPA